ncbi:3-isopropylmalate dehydrogenase [Candidatus Poribacteria bacterium]|nr:3-isopropylmalate dehydrogenase [Candidatus Poribacteria bacterium]
MNIKIAVLPGDGIGQEVTAQVIRALDAIHEKYGHCFEYEYALIGGCAIDERGTALPMETLELCRKADAILFGAAGGPKWEDVPSPERPERALATVRKALDLFVNLRPIRGRKALAPVLPVKSEIIGEGLDFIVIRELAGGIYYGEPRGIVKDDDGERGFNTLSYTTREIDRVMRAGFELARNRSQKLTSVAKENMLESSKLWREVATKVGQDYPDVALNHILIDACAYHIIRNPSQFDVIVTGNIFGDILTDEAAVLVGSLGMCPSASYGDTRQGLYEPIHGTAPDIAGQGIANPIAAILSAALLLRHSLALETEAADIEAAVDGVIDSGYRTVDIRQAGMKTVGTIEMTDAIIAEIRGVKLNPI